MHYGTVESPECLETSVPFNDSVTSLVNFSADFTSFSMPLKVPSSSEELTKKTYTHKEIQKSTKITKRLQKLLGVGHSHGLVKVDSRELRAMQLTTAYETNQREN